MKANSTVLKQSAATLRNWCVDHALPVWAARAQREDGSWVEHLHLNGTPDLSAERRWRVLARQVYVYAQATRAGWYDGRAVAQTTFDRMCAIGPVHRVAPDGTITDATRDLYDLAFYVLAASSLYSVTRTPEHLAKAESWLAWMDATLTHPNGGWRESDRVDTAAPRRQNPHMHLLEASLYLHGITGQTKHLSVARKVYDLFEAHIFDAGIIREFFRADWRVTPGTHGDTVEPGHAMEWVWLLGQYAQATGTQTQTYQDALYDRAMTARGIFLNDEEDVAGNIRRETKRLWVQTETIKAHLAMAERGVSGSAEMAAATIDALFGIYLTPEGLWQDQINACHANVATTIPVSTMYHILCLAVEAERVANL